MECVRKFLQLLWSIAENFVTRYHSRHIYFKNNLIKYALVSMSRKFCSKLWTIIHVIKVGSYPGIAFSACLGLMSLCNLKIIDQVVPSKETTFQDDLNDELFSVRSLLSIMNCVTNKYPIPKCGMLTTKLYNLCNLRCKMHVAFLDRKTWQFQLTWGLLILLMDIYPQAILTISSCCINIPGHS